MPILSRQQALTSHRSRQNGRGVRGVRGSLGCRRGDLGDVRISHSERIDPPLHSLMPSYLAARILWISLQLGKAKSGQATMRYLARSILRVRSACVRKIRPSPAPREDRRLLRRRPGLCGSIYDRPKLQRRPLPADTERALGGSPRSPGGVVFGCSSCGPVPSRKAIRKVRARRGCKSGTAHPLGDAFSLGQVREGRTQTYKRAGRVGGDQACFPERFPSAPLPRSGQRILRVEKGQFEKKDPLLHHLGLRGPSRDRRHLERVASSRRRRGGAELRARYGAGRRGARRNS